MGKVSGELSVSPLAVDNHDLKNAGMIIKILNLSLSKDYRFIYYHYR